jgi:hypothetical protein
MDKDGTRSWSEYISRSLYVCDTISSPAIISGSVTTDVLTVNDEANMSSTTIITLPDPSYIQFETPIYQSVFYTMDMLPGCVPFATEGEHDFVEAYWTAFETESAVHNSSDSNVGFTPVKFTVHPFRGYRPDSNSKVPYSDACNDDESNRRISWPCIRLDTSDNNTQVTDFRFTFELYPGKALKSINIGATMSLQHVVGTYPRLIDNNAEFTCEVFSLATDRSRCANNEEGLSSQGHHLGREAYPGFSSEALDDDGDPCTASPGEPGGALVKDVYSFSDLMGVCEYTASDFPRITFSFDGQEVVEAGGNYIVKISATADDEDVYITYVEMVYEIKNLAGALQVVSSKYGIGS